MGLQDRDWFWEGYEERYGYSTKKRKNSFRAEKNSRLSNNHNTKHGWKNSYYAVLILSVLVCVVYKRIEGDSSSKLTSIRGFLPSKVSLNPIYSIILFAILIGIIIAALIGVRERAIGKKIEMLRSNTLTLSPQQFFELRNTKSGGRGRIVASQYSFAGVYILYNKSKNMYYVGQAKKILDRVNAHFTGHGNGDVYADYKYGDVFEINMIALENSGFSSLNELERHAINKYNAFSKGYNKTRGNSN